MPTPHSMHPSPGGAAPACSRDGPVLHAPDIVTVPGTTAWLGCELGALALYIGAAYGCGCAAAVCAACSRYGLQHLSDQVLGDLCASICHHAAAGLLPARWFACFCGLGPALKPKKKQRLLGPWQLPGRGYTGSAAAEQGAGGGSGRASPAAGGSHSHKALRGLSGADAEVLLGSAAAADFWVFCACQLAYPNSVVALFPEAQEALIRSNLAMESIKAAFRCVCDRSMQKLLVEALSKCSYACQSARHPPCLAPSAVGKRALAGTLWIRVARHSLWQRSSIWQQCLQTQLQQEQQRAAARQEAAAATRLRAAAGPALAAAWWAGLGFMMPGRCWTCCSQSGWAGRGGGHAPWVVYGGES